MKMKQGRNGLMNVRTVGMIEEEEDGGGDTVKMSIIIMMLLYYVAIRHFSTSSWHPHLNVIYDTLQIPNSKPFKIVHKRRAGSFKVFKRQHRKPEGRSSTDRECDCDAMAVNLGVDVAYVRWRNDLLLHGLRSNYSKGR